jgi:hypothetical protein
MTLSARAELRPIFARRMADIRRRRYRPRAINSGIRDMLAIIHPGATFKDNLRQLPPVDEVRRIDLVDGAGAVVASIENQPGKQGSLAVYQYLKQSFGSLDAQAAEHGLAVFAEHTADARSRPGAHPNVDHLLVIAAGGAPLHIEVTAASR